MPFYRMVALLGCCAVLLCGGCRRTKPSAPPPPSSSDSAEETGMRGVWLSYIELDDLLRDTNPTTAKDRIEAVMDTCRAKGLNTVFFHLRAHGDAYYPSQVWPVANAAQAVIAAGFDPLSCALDAAHARGLQLHGWLNPYRLSVPLPGLSFEKNDVWHLDPANPAARQSVLDGVREILNRYPIDGIHFDDYFYPTGMRLTGEAFENIPSGTDVTRWRQTQVDTLISSVYGLCHQYGKPFGISPDGNIHRNRTEAYADVTRWMVEPGYIDYICPQLYTGFRHESAPFAARLTEWQSLPRRSGVALYVGLALYKVGLANDPYAGSGANEWATDKDIIPRQIRLAEEATDGYVLFRYEDLVNN